MFPPGKNNGILYIKETPDYLRLSLGAMGKSAIPLAGIRGDVTWLKLGLRKVLYTF